jgi:hypothetical protein
MIPSFLYIYKKTGFVFFNQCWAVSSLAFRQLSYRVKILTPDGWFASFGLTLVGVSLMTQLTGVTISWPHPLTPSAHMGREN